MIITHITALDRWREAAAAGSYRADSLDSEGFIHFSLPAQVEATANRFYRGAADLVLLIVETDKLTARLVFEPPGHPTVEGEVFPHLYGELNADAVMRVVELIAQPDGSFKVDPSAL